MVEAARVPAQNLDAEASVLSAILIDPEALDRVRDVFTPADCYADANRLVYQAALDLDAEARPIDMVTVAERLKAAGHLDRIGGTSYIMQLEREVPSVAQLEAHARIVSDKAIQRRVTALAQRLAAEGYDDREDVKAWAENAAQALSDLASGGEERDPAEMLSTLVPQALTEIQEKGRSGKRLAGVPTGFRAVDRLLLGMETGKSHVVGARPGMGKTAYALQTAVNIASTDKLVVFVSAEMEKRELTERAIASTARVGLTQIRTGQVRNEWGDVVAAAKFLVDKPLAIAHRPGATISQIRSIVRSEKRRTKKPLGLIVVDYIQILNGERKRGESREQEISDLSKRLMWLAAEFKAPLMLLSQLNRALEGRANASKRPTLSDLRESGAIEQDAYSVTLLYRDEYYNPRTEDQGVLEAIIAKNRGAPTGLARLRFRGDCTRIEDDPTVSGEYGDFENGDAI
jgi:replicative DNA helicase